jgi:hypothetical protein
MGKQKQPAKSIMRKKIFLVEMKKAAVRGFRNGACRKLLNAVRLIKITWPHIAAHRLFVNELYVRLIGSNAADGQIARICLMRRWK